MARFAFFSIPFSGHVNPTLGLVAELVARGHEVVYAATDDFGHRIAEAGAMVVPFPTTMRSASFEETLAKFAAANSFDAADVAAAMGLLAHEAEVTLEPLAAAFKGQEPDLVVYDTQSWVGRLLADRWQVPYVQSQIMMSSDEHWAPEDAAASESFFAEFAERLGALAAGEGSTAVRDILGLTPTPTVVYIPRAFQPGGETFGEHIHFIGPSMHRSQVYGTWRPPRGGLPLALISPGTSVAPRAGFFRACLDAFATLPWTAVLAVGDHIDPADLTDVPANVEVHRFVPYHDVLPHADLVICQAGLITVMESLRAGAPLLVVPHMPEQRLNADRVADLGLGVRLAPDEVTAATLRAAVDAAGSPEIQHNVRAMRREIHISGGAAEGADAIEARLA